MKSIKLFVLLIILQSCSKIHIASNFNKAEMSVSSIIINDIKQNYSDSYFKDASVIVITKYDSLKDGSTVYGVFNESYVFNSIVRPDSIDFFLKDFAELNNKLYVWENSNRKVKPSVIYGKLKKYGVKLDSCLLKYHYLECNPEKYTNCLLNNKTIDPYPNKKLYYVLESNKKGIVKITKKRKLSSWYWNNRLESIAVQHPQ